MCIDLYSKSLEVYITLMSEILKGNYMSKNERLVVELSVNVKDSTNKYAHYVEKVVKQKIHSLAERVQKDRHYLRYSSNAKVPGSSIELSLSGHTSRAFEGTNEFMGVIQKALRIEENGEVSVVAQLKENSIRKPHVVNFKDCFWFGPEVESYKIHKRARGRKIRVRVGYDDIIQDIYVVGEGSWAKRCASEIRKQSNLGRADSVFPDTILNDYSWRSNFLYGKCFIMIKCKSGMYIVTRDAPLRYTGVNLEERGSIGYRIGAEHLPAFSENMIEMNNIDIVNNHPIQSKFKREEFFNQGA